MNDHKRWLITCFSGFCLLFSACAEHEVHFTSEPPPLIDSFMEPEEVKVVLPQAGDVALVEQYCLSCHSLRYIEMQPRMSHKAWQKTVDKMIKAYGAPVRDSETATRIVNYLWAIKQEK